MYNIKLIRHKKNEIPQLTTPYVLLTLRLGFFFTFCALIIVFLPNRLEIAMNKKI